MKTLITLATGEGKKLYKKSFNNHGGHGDPEKLARFYSPGEEIEIICSTDELEEFENANEIALTSDIISDSRDFTSFVNWLTSNYKLKAF